jgi:hypothetical protein
MLPDMPDEPPSDDKLALHVVQPKRGIGSSSIRTNEQQWREASRKLAERHKAALRPSPNTASSQA